METIVFSETDPINEKGYVTCDYCHKSGMHDLWDNREIRAFYYMEPDGLYICEHCLGEIDL